MFLDIDKINGTRFYGDIVRFAVASRDIVVGDVLTVEKAIVSHMLPEYMVIIFSIIILKTFKCKYHHTYDDHHRP